MLKALLAAAVAASQAPAAPDPARCITREEVGDISLVGASVAVEFVRSACRPHLPETAFLVAPAGAEFAARLRAEGQRRLDSALEGMARLSADRTDRAASREMMRTFVRGMMTEGAGAGFASFADESLCRDANEIMEIASTLSPDQMARFVGAFASIADHIARMPPIGPTHIVPVPRPPESPPPALRPAPPETAPPTPHPAAFEAPARHAPPPVVIMPAVRPPAPPPPPRPPRPPMRPFLCGQPR